MMHASVRRLAALALLLSVVLGACASPAPSEDSGNPLPATLAGTDWKVVSVGGLAPAPGAEPTVSFAQARVQGSGGCNQFGGEYRYDPASGRIEFTNLGMTAMGCLRQDVMAFEEAFSRVLTSAVQVSVDPATRLILSGPAGAVVLVRTANPA